jgi:hypothetical protein
VSPGTYEDLWDTTFARYVNAIPCTKRFIVMAQCYSGGFIDNLQGTSVPTFMLTATDYLQASLEADDVNPDAEGDIRENEYALSRPWFHSEFNYHVLNAMRYPLTITNHRILDPVDITGNGAISMSEVLDWEMTRDSQVPANYIPQYLDEGIGSTTFINRYTDLATRNKTTSSGATAYNNSRKLYRQSSGTLHEVFESGLVTGGEIFYRSSTDNGTTWSNTARLSDGIMTSLAPCITMGSSATNVIVAWQQTNGPNYNVLFRRSTDGGTTWGSITALQLNFSCASPGPLPSVSANTQTGRVVVVYRSSSGLRYVQSPDNMASWTGPTGVPGSTSANHNSPSTAYYANDVNNCNLAFATDVGSSSVIDYCSYSGTWSALTNLSSALPSYYQWQRNPSVASTTSIAPPLCHVAWEATDMQSGAAPVVIHRKGTSGNFGSQYSVINHQRAASPSISGLASDNAWMVFQRTQQGALGRVRYSYSGGQWTWGTPVNGPAGNYGQISVGSTTAKYLYTSGTSSPYTVNLGSESLTKEDPLAMVYFRELNFIDTMTGSCLTLEIEQPKVVHKDGTVSSIAFTDVPPDSVFIPTTEILSYGKTSPFAVTALTDTLRVRYTFRSVNSAAMLGEGGAHYAFSLLDGKTGKALTTIDTATVAKSADMRSSSLEIMLPGVQILNLSSGAGLLLDISLSGAKVDGTDLIASLGHIYRSTGAGAVELPKHLVAEDLGPKAYRLEQNYPNPFNPSTNLRYGLPEAAHVTLVVYNTLGQKVVELVNGHMRAGYHEARWDAVGLASGVYFARLTASNTLGQVLANQTAKLVLMR